MAADSVELCNLALAHLGEAPITALNDGTARANACDRVYELVRDELLRSHRWNFAVARSALSENWLTMESIADSSGDVQITDTAHGLTAANRVALKDTEGIDGIWDIESVTTNAFILTDAVWTDSLTAGSYRLCPDFGWDYQYDIPAACLRVLEVNDSEDGDTLNPWVIEGRKLLTNDATCNLVYLKQETDVTKYDALFVQALALKLAISISEILRGTTGKTAELMQAYDRVTAPLARRVDSNEARRRKGLLPMNSLAIKSRMGV